ncbi:MAG: HAMP domain-containing sensor histidine kinase [Bacilli bacterium]
MFKSKETKKFFFTLVFTSLIIIILFVLISNIIYHTCNKQIINNSSYIINDLILKHPELEDDIIDAVINNEGNSDGKQLLDKYGIDLEGVSYLKENNTLKNKIMNLNLSVICISLAGILVITLIFLSRQNKKFKSLSSYMNNILNDDYSMNILDYTEGDLSNLSNDIYKVTVKLKEQNDITRKDKKYLEEILSDISHQLKTPLTSMYVINDLLDTDLDDNIRKEFLQKNKAQLSRIEWLVTSLLKISRLDSGTIVLKPKKIKLETLINKSLEPLLIPMELKNINLKLDIDFNMKMVIDLNWTSEALINIIKNACEHTDENGTIRIYSEDNPIYQAIIIEDNGNGISEDDLPFIFERFFKGKSNKESIGIGLNMAKKIIDMQKGDISVKSEIGKYTAFTIKFYKNVI